jgi:hypothetical protein
MSFDIEEVLNSILESTKTLLGFSDVTIFICQDDEFNLRAVLGDYFSDNPHSSYKMGEGGICAAAETGTPKIIENVPLFPSR